MRVAALEDNVAFLEEWCEEQQDALDRTAGPIGYDYEFDRGPERPAPARAALRVVDLRDGAAADGEEAEAGHADSIFAVVETEYDRRIRQVRAQINRLRSRLALSVAPPPEETPGGGTRGGEPPAPRRAAGKKNVSAKPAGRTAP